MREAIPDRKKMAYASGTEGARLERSVAGKPSLEEVTALQ
jgi:hypothetical protein